MIRAPHSARTLPDSSDLRRLALEFAALRDAMETDFVSAGDRLIETCDRFQSLEAPMLRIAGLTESATVPRIVSEVHALDRMVREQIGAIGGAIRPLLDLSASTQPLKSDILDLARVVRTMGIVALNARVIVACMDAGTRDVTGFTSDADLLVSGAVDLLRQMVIAVERLSAVSKQTRVAADEFTKTLDMTIASRLHDLANGLQVTEDWLKRTVSSSGALSKRVAAVRGDVSATVMSLQSGDATRQRLDHVSVTLDAAADVTDAGFQRALLDLVRRQVESASVEHLRNLDEACDALDRTGRGTLALLADLDGAFSNGTPGVGLIHDTLARLQDALGDCRNTHAAFSTRTDALISAYRQIIDQAEGIRGLGGKMQLVGMNAVIACSNLGAQGLPLKETALQLQTLATSAQASHQALGRSLSWMEAVSSQSQAALGEGAAKLAEILAGEQSKIADLLGVEGIEANPVVDMLRGILTMQQERDVHDAWLAGFTHEKYGDDIQRDAKAVFNAA